MKHILRIFPLVLCFLLVSVILWVEWKPSVKLQNNHSEQKERPRFSAAEFGNNVVRQYKPIQELNGQLKRGENKRLRYGEVEEIERETIAGKRFSGQLFHVLDRKSLGPLSKSKETLSVVDAQWERGAVQRLIDSDAELITVPLGRGRSADVRIEKMLLRGSETVTLLGKDASDPEGDVLLVFHDGAVFGTVAYYDTNTHFEYASSGDGNVAIRLLNPLAFTAACGQPGDSALSEVNDNSNSAVSGASEGIESYDGANITIDYVVGYGIAARQAEGGTAAIEARIIASVDRTNLAFANSGLGDEVELVLLGTIEDPVYSFPGAIDGNMGSGDELGNLQNEVDGVLDVVTDFKLALGADGSAFVVSSADGSAGVAYRPGESMIVARTYMTSTRITFVHELGHNIGCNHSWGDSSSDEGTSQHNYGWRFTTTSSSKVRTVMSYDWGWTRIPYFSDPEINYQGAPTGAVDGYDASASSSADPRYVYGGYTVVAGAGFDGSNPNLGARNANYILANASYLANREERVAPKIQLEEATGNPRIEGSEMVDIGSEIIGQTVSNVLTVRNVGGDELESLTIELQGEDSSSFSLTSPSATNLELGETATFEVSYHVNGTGQKKALLVVSDSGLSGVEFCIPITGALRSEFYAESFENGMGIWADAGSEISWDRDSGGTTSSNTGPSSGSESAWYLYTEASSGANDSTAEIEAAFDFSTKMNLHIKFDYHMYGADMGTLSVDVYSDGEWDNAVWELSGQQQLSSAESWRTAVVDLSDYDEMDDVKIRFRGLTGFSYRSDMAIDSIKLFGAEVIKFATWTSEQSLSRANAGILATPEGDGIENLLKYAFNMTVPVSGPRVITPGTGTTGLPYFTLPTDVGDSLTVEFLRNRSASDLSYRVVFSNDLVDGEEVSNGVESSVTAIDADWERVIVEDEVEVGEVSRRFGKVIVEIDE
ncbi:reprolysin-like metallopeptidase [Rubritalea spongiae]|uniref:Reprolysin-like metallopeptidase n=1 Tax=Rubritalea spongiae TaxID=430797 RepID=A0ABW5E0D2_9BACT